MFQLSAEHLAAFGRASLENFEDRLAGDLRLAWPKQTAALSDREMADLIHASIERAESFGFKTEFDLACFGEAAVLLGPRFDVDPRLDVVYSLLREEGVSPRKKAARLCRFVHRTVPK